MNLHHRGVLREKDNVIIYIIIMLMSLLLIFFIYKHKKKILIMLKPIGNKLINIFVPYLIFFVEKIKKIKYPYYWRFFIGLFFILLYTIYQLVHIENKDKSIWLLIIKNTDFLFYFYCLCFILLQSKIRVLLQNNFWLGLIIGFLLFHVGYWLKGLIFFSSTYFISLVLFSTGKILTYVFDRKRKINKEK